MIALSAALAIVTAAVAAIALAVPEVFRDPPMTVGNARGTALVLLVIGVPMLVAGMVGTARGSARALTAWLAALGYILYNAVLFCFAARFNPLFLGFVAMLSLALWSVVLLGRAIDPVAVGARFAARTPARIAAIWLAANAALFGLVWLRDIFPAVVAGTAPASFTGTDLLTSPVHVLDLAITIPLLVVAAVALWRRRAWGHVLGPALVVMLVVETGGIAVDQVFGNLHDPAAPLGAVPVLAAMTVVGAAIAVALLRRADGTETASAQASAILANKTT